MDPQQLSSTIQQLGLQYAKRPNDKIIAIAYATALRTDNRNDQSLAVMRRLAIGHPEDRDVLSLWKALSNGQFDAALDAIQEHKHLNILIGSCYRQKVLFSIKQLSQMQPELFTKKHYRSTQVSPQSFPTI